MNINFAPAPQQPGGIVDPNEVIRRQELARALQQRSGGIQDIESPWQGLAQVSDAVFGGINAKSAADGAKQNNQFLAEALGPAMQGNLPPEKLNQIMALDPKLGMQLVERQQEQAKAAEAKAQEDAQRQQVSAALRAMGATREADAFDARIIPAEKAYELLIAGEKQPDQPSYGLTPIPGQVGDKFGYAVLGTDGSFKPVDTGDFQPLDPRALNIEKAAGTAIGKGQGANELAAPGMAVALDQMDAKTDNILAEIDKAVGQVAWDSTGAVGQVMGALGGTKAYDLRSTAGTIKANLGFAELQAMRDASPTGGALGQVAVQELEALQSTLASLDPNQSDGQLLANLEKIKVLLERQKEFRRQAAGAKYSTPAPSGPNAPEGVWVYNPATGKLEQQ